MIKTRKTGLPNCPKWLKDAVTIDEEVTICPKTNRICWLSGTFLTGEFLDGKFLGGKFLGGEFRGGKFLGGEFRGGEFKGSWKGGVWQQGKWALSIDRIRYFLSLIGCPPNSKGICTAYRVTKPNGQGKYNSTFIQPIGKYFEKNLSTGIQETCVPGIHCTSAARAYNYFGVNITDQFWEVKFHIDDILGCDGEKIRIRGGTFKKIKRPF